jgi:hypothetical protein
MPSESHKSIQFIDLKVVDPTVYAVHAFQNQGDIPQVRSCWGAFEYFALNDGEISSLDGEDTSMVYGNFIYTLDPRKLHLELSWVHGTCPKLPCPGIERWLLHKMPSYVRLILVRHHGHLGLPSP